MSAPCPTFGFTMELRLAPGASDVVLLDTLTRDVLEPRSLHLVGRPGLASVYLVRGEGLQATDADRQAASAWLAQRPDVVNYAVGPLVDLGGDG